jgi:hypothetical protein
MRPLAVLALVAACNPARSTPTTPTPGTPPAPVTLTVAVEVTSISQATLLVTSSAPASVAAACVRTDLPAEAHLLEAELSAGGELPFAGLAADTAYDCRVVPLDPVGPVVSVSFRTLVSPVRLASADVVRHATLEPTGGYTVMTVRPDCEGRGSYVTVLDNDGEGRWRYELPPATNIGVEVTLDGPDRFLWGGGQDTSGAATVVGVTEGVVWRLGYPGSEDVVYHHDVHRLHDGRVLSVEETRPDGWAAFQLRLVDTPGETSWLWNAQQGVDEGWLDAGDADHVDPHHLNWADVVATEDGLVAYASLCYERMVVAIDVETNALQWRFGPGGDFDLVDGPPDDFPQCQHGLQTDGTHLLVYDNGQDRGYTRAVEYTLDAATGEARKTWDWRDEGFFERYHGGVDWLDEAHQRVLVAEGNNACDPTTRHSQVVEVDREQDDAVVHRLVLRDVADWIYRAHRVDGCSLFANVRYCAPLAARLEELRPALAL